MVTVVAGVAPAAGATGSGGAQPPSLVPIDGRLFGRTYSGWSIEWWQWAFSVPMADGALTDTTGARCGAGQHGAVWFLAGFYGDPVGNVFTADRACTVPYGKGIFFPIINAEADSVCRPLSGVQAEMAVYRDLLDHPKVVQATIDGKPVRDATSFRAVTRPFLILNVPAESLAADLGGESCPAGSSGIALSDGYYVMLKPLSRGHHTITFTGEVEGFALDISYDLTVM
jgi:hypothetical protein